MEKVGEKRRLHIEKKACLDKGKASEGFSIV